MVDQGSKLEQIKETLHGVFSESPGVEFCCLRFTYTIPLGFPVMGIWPDEADGTDVNSLCRSSTEMSSDQEVRDLLVTCGDGRLAQEGYLVTADDDSFVKLFNYPVLADDAPFRCYRGHSSHVMCIRWELLNSQERFDVLFLIFKVLLWWSNCFQCWWIWSVSFPVEDLWN